MSDDHTYVVPAGPHDYALLDRDIHGPLDHSTKPLYHTNTNYNNMSMDGTTNHSGTNGHAQQQQAMALQIKKLSPNARAPTRGSKYAAGYDIYAAETKIVPGRGKAMIGTGIAIAVPVGTCMSHPSFPTSFHVTYLLRLPAHIESHPTTH